MYSSSGAFIAFLSLSRAIDIDSIRISHALEKKHNISHDGGDLMVLRCLFVCLFIVYLSDTVLFTNTQPLGAYTSL